MPLQGEPQVLAHEVANPVGATNVVGVFQHGGVAAGRAEAVASAAGLAEGLTGDTADVEGQTPAPMTQQEKMKVCYKEAGGKALTGEEGKKFVSEC